MGKPWMDSAEYERVPLDKIVVGDDRARKEMDVRKLAESITEKGLLQPIVVKPTDDGRYLLVAGERRYRASILAGRTDIPVVMNSELDPLMLKVIEMEENEQRKDFTMQEHADLVEQIDTLRKKLDPNWRQKDTADVLGLSKGHVSLQIKVAKEMRKDPDLREKSKNMDIRAVAKLIDRKKEVAKAERLVEQGTIKLSHELLHGSCLDLIKDVKAESVDLVVTDPPYGVERINKLTETGYSPGFKLMNPTHNQDLSSVLAILGELGRELMRVLVPGAHAYFFSSLQYVGDFIRVLEEAGLEFQPPTLIWDRKRSTQPGFGYNYMNRTEAIAYFHKPPRKRRLVKNMPNVLEASEVPRRDRKFHTEKPQSLLGTMISQSSKTGDLVLDPFAGSGSTILAARDLGRRGLGFEVDADTYKRASMRLAGIEVSPDESV
jgi:site-specific DNA-methyltransferase (adenine-specific)